MVLGSILRPALSAGWQLAEGQLDRQFPCVAEQRERDLVSWVGRGQDTREGLRVGRGRAARRADDVPGAQPGTVGGAAARDGDNGGSGRLAVLARDRADLGADRRGASSSRCRR